MEEQIQALKKMIADSKGKYTGQRSYAYKLVRYYKVPLVILSAISTIVLGLQFGEDVKLLQMQKNVALVIAAIITLLTTFLTYWNLEEYWMQNKVVEHQLIMLEHKFAFEEAKGLDQAGMDALFKELQNILLQQQSYWKNAMSELGNSGEN